MNSFEDDADIDDDDDGLEREDIDWDLPGLPTLTTDENGRELFFDSAPEAP